MDKLHFNHATMSLLDKQFGVRRVFQSNALDAWLQSVEVLSGIERFTLETLQHSLVLNSLAWNEREMALFFTGGVFSAFEFTVPYQFNLFSGRNIRGIRNDILLEGTPDGFIASGYREPETPYFVYHAYKRNIEPTTDPAAVVLAAMLACQGFKGQDEPVYGCYIIDTSWTFMVLEGNHYCNSRPFLASNHTLFDIGRILKELKQILLKVTPVPVPSA